MNLLSWSYSLTLSTGVVINYWVMQKMLIDMPTAQAQVEYWGYLDQTAQQAGKDPVVKQSCNIDFSSFDPTGQLAAGVIAMVSAIQAAGG